MAAPSVLVYEQLHLRRSERTRLAATLSGAGLVAYRAAAHGNLTLVQGLRKALGLRDKDAGRKKEMNAIWVLDESRPTSPDQTLVQY